MWKDLTLSQKADIIKMAVKQGMRNINDIQSFYDKVSGNSGRFKDGGNLHGEKSSKNNTSYQAPSYAELDEAVLGEVMQQFRNIAHPGNSRDASYKGDVRGKNGGTAQRTYLLPRFEQEDIFLRDGYIKGKERDYGLVKKAVNNRNLPVWQTAPDAINRETLVPIGNVYGHDYGYIGLDKDLVHAGARPAAFYVDGSTGKLYTKGWDLNDYGGSTGAASSKYNIFEKIGANLLDFIGNPVVVTTGFQEVTNPWGGPGEHLNKGATIQDLFVPDDEGYPVATTVGKMLDDTMSKKGLHRENIDGKWLYTLPEVTITGKKKAYGGDLGDPPMKQDTFSKSYKPPLPDQPIRFHPTVTEKKDVLQSSKVKDRQKFFEHASEKEKYEYRRKEAAQEKRNKELKNFMEGLNNTFGTAASLSALVYGGGWAANRLLLGNKASSVGQTLGKYMLPANTLDSYGDVAQFITDPSASNALELGTSIIGKKYNDYTKKGRQLYELGTQGLNAYNTFK